MSACFCGRPLPNGAKRYCCRDHERLYIFALEQLHRPPLTFEEVERVWNLAHPEKAAGTVEQLPLLPNVGR